MRYVATHEIDDRPACDHKTGERLSPHLVKVGRQTEYDAMTRHQLFEGVPIEDAADEFGFGEGREGRGGEGGNPPSPNSKPRIYMYIRII